MEEKFQKYLPLGSVVLLKGAKKRVMVTGYVVKSSDVEGRIFDYIGCLYPEGMISQDKNLLFDHKDIEKIYALGYADDEEKAFMHKLNRLVSVAENNENN